MRKGFKKFVSIISAAVLACGAASLAACGYSFTPLADVPPADAVTSSNGGFVVEKGEYVYFINGVETYTSDNTYGTPEKGALMRIKRENLDKGVNNAEVVIPSLMVSGDTTAGIFIYGDRVYYATPNNMKNTSGVIENTYLDFKSAKLDGSDIKNYFYLADNSTKFRYVEAGEGEKKAVYLLYAGTDEDGTAAIISYNTKTEESVTLVSGQLSYVFNNSDKTDPNVYYTMSVTDKADSDGPLSHTYQQIYRVRADWTEKDVPGAYDASAPYSYTWDQAWLDENNDGKLPYHNYGELVLDGKGKLAGENTQFNHSESEPSINTDGYTYTLRSYDNGGIYFVRTGGSDGALYYLSAEKVAADGWDSIAGNATGLEKVASDTDVSSRATTSALYFIEKDANNQNLHRYLYVLNENIYLAKAENGRESDLAIAYNVSGASLKIIDNTSDAAYKYVYFSKSNGSGTSVERAVYNGEEIDYRELQYDNRNSKPFKSVKVLDLQHATGWYDFEVVGGTLFYADAETIGSVSYNYVSCVDLKNADGSLKNNEQLASVNEKYEEIMGTKGLVQTLSSNSNSKLSALISYYFKSGESKAMKENIDESVVNGQSDTYLFSGDEQTAFNAFVAPEGDDETPLFGKDDYKDENGKYYRTYSYFVTRIGKMTEADEEAIDLAWRNSIQRYAVAEQEETGLEGWKIALIVIACVLVAAGCAGAVTYFLLRKKKGTGEPAEERMNVDTTDDRSVDVYTPIEEPVTPAEPTEATETTETAETTEASAETAEPVATAETNETAEPVAAPAETTETTATTETPAEPVAAAETTETTEVPAETTETPVETTEATEATATTAEAPAETTGTTETAETTEAPATTTETTEAAETAETATPAEATEPTEATETTATTTETTETAEPAEPAETSAETAEAPASPDADTPKE